MAHTPKTQYARAQSDAQRAEYHRNRASAQTDEAWRNSDENHADAYMMMADKSVASLVAAGVDVDSPLPEEWPGT